MSIVLPVEDQVDKVESGEESRWELDVVDDGEFRIVLRVYRVCCCKDGCTGIQRTDDACLGHRDCLLLHGFVQDHTC
jgi:hypothetical protein